MNNYEVEQRRLLDIARAYAGKPGARCELGLVAIEMPFEDKQPALALLDGHGVEAEWDGAAFHGVLARGSDTLIDGPGGLAVPQGAIIRHDAYTCAMGRYEAGR